MKFTHIFFTTGGWAETNYSPSDYEEVKYLGKCYTDGDMFVAYSSMGYIHIFKGILEEELKTDTWYKHKDNPWLVFRIGDRNNYAIIRDEERKYFHCLDQKNWQEATEEEVKEALVKVAKKKGFKNIGELRLKSINGNIFEKGSFETLHNTFRFEADTLYLDSVEIFQDEKWAEILEEEELKKDTWYRDIYRSELVYRTGNQENYGIKNYEDSDSFNCFTAQLWQEATEEEVEETLVKLAKKKGFKNINELKLKLNGKVFKKGDFILVENDFTFHNNTLSLDGVEIFNKGKWAEILEEEEPLTILNIEERLKRLEEKVNGND